MKKTKSSTHIIIFLICLMAAVVPFFANAEENKYGGNKAYYVGDFVKMTPNNFIDTLIRFGVIKISQDDVIDDYAKLNECEMFYEFYKNDFKWNAFRKALRKSIVRNAASFPMAYYYDNVVQLDRYDFKKKMFRFTEKTTPSNVNLFSMQLQDTACDASGFSVLPSWYGIVLDDPLTIYGLSLSEKDAKSLVDRMLANNNEDRIVYVRFKIRITQVPYVSRMEDKKGNTIGPMFQDGGSAGQIKIGGRMDSVEFFEDSERTKMIYLYSQ